MTHRRLAGIALANYTIATYQQKQTFKLTQPVNAGDTISFISYTGNNRDSLSTGLQAKVVMK